jgi:chitinase
LNLLSSAKSDGVALSVVNIMTMDYGTSGIEMGSAATEAAAATETQIQQAGLTSTVGITPMIGQNDSSGEIFTLADATTLLNFANANSYVSRLAMWSMGRDNGSCAGDTSSSPSCSGISQSNYEFSSIFKAY